MDKTTYAARPERVNWFSCLPEMVLMLSSRMGTVLGIRSSMAWVTCSTAREIVTPIGTVLGDMFVFSAKVLNP